MTELEAWKVKLAAAQKRFSDASTAQMLAQIDINQALHRIAELEKKDETAQQK